MSPSTQENCRPDHNNYRYDAEGNRLEAIHAGQDPAYTVRFVYFNGQVVADLLGNNSLRSRYLRGDKTDQLFGNVAKLGGQCSHDAHFADRAKGPGLRA